MSLITENSILTFGIHKGKRINETPAAWLVEWSLNVYARGPLQNYIKENIHSIKLRAENGK